jgi:hypothetical protein
MDTAVCTNPLPILHNKMAVPLYCSFSYRTTVFTEVEGLIRGLLYVMSMACAQLPLLSFCSASRASGFIWQGACTPPGLLFASKLILLRGDTNFYFEVAIKKVYQ